MKMLPFLAYYLGRYNIKNPTCQRAGSAVGPSEPSNAFPFPTLAYHFPKPLIAIPDLPRLRRLHGHCHGDPAAMLARAPGPREATSTSLLSRMVAPPCRSLPSPKVPHRHYYSWTTASRPGLLPQVPNLRIISISPGSERSAATIGASFCWILIGFLLCASLVLQVHAGHGGACWLRPSGAL
jgi:hypothetical protein